MLPFKHILVPTDFGESSKRALEVAIAMADKYQASLTLLHVCEIPVYSYPGMTIGAVDLLTPIQTAAREMLANTLAEVTKQVPGATGTLALGVAWREIEQAVADTHADLIVMGTHGRRGVMRALLGSVAQRTVQMSKVPVLTVPGVEGAKEPKPHP
jgi:nucleotide-binding universal stress UspA family protein